MKKGSLKLSLSAIVMLFVIGFTFVIGSTIIWNHLWPVIMEDPDTAINNPEAEQALRFIGWAWNLWPYIAIIVLILFVLIISQTREPREPYYARGV